MFPFALIALQTAWKPYNLDGFSVSLPSPPVEEKDPTMPKGSRMWISMHNGRNAIVLTTGIVPKTPAIPTDQLLAGILMNGSTA